MATIAREPTTAAVAAREETAPLPAAGRGYPLGPPLAGLVRLAAGHR